MWSWGGEGLADWAYRGRGGTGTHTNNLLGVLNADQSLDASLLLNSLITEDENISQFFQTQINSIYSDADIFIDTFRNTSEPLIISLNVQSLSSKYNQLKIFINRLLDANLPIDMIVLQETWGLKYPLQLNLPGFQNIVFRTRDGMRGGGVGIYVRNGLNYKERKDLDDYKQKTFENIVLEVQYPSKSILISNIYRSPTPPPNTSPSDHLENFTETLDSHLSKLSDLNKPSYIFLDANINLLRLKENIGCTDYMDTLITNGFVQLISKATRIQNDKTSLIDHILTNTNQCKYNAGTIIEDLSDHFINYLQISSCKQPNANSKPSKMRILNETNITALKTALLHTDWQPVYADSEVDSSFDTFWTIFNGLFSEHCPVTQVRFNKNKHRINAFMNDDLLAERNLKLHLHKTFISTKQQEDFDNYIQQRNKYNTLLRKSKQKFYSDNLNLNVNNSKRTWQLLKEAANLNKTTQNIEKIDKKRHPNNKSYRHCQRI